MPRAPRMPSTAILSLNGASHAWSVRRPSVDVTEKGSPAPLSPVPGGAMRQLLFDDFLLGFGSKPEHFMHAVRFSVGKVAKHGEPIFEGEEPWE